MAKRTLTLGALGLGLVVGLLGLPAVTPPAWGQVACGEVIGPGEIVILTGNVGPCTEDPALTVEGPAIFILNGFTVSCAQDSIDTPVGIHVIGVRALVAHGTVRDCGLGMLIEGDGSHHISRITSRDNSHGFLINSGRNTLSFNTALDNGGIGFRILGSFNVLSFNKARSNDLDGFEIFGDNNELTGNYAGGNSDGFEIQASNNRLSFNVASANDSTGFFVNGDNNSLTHNVAKQNGTDGIVVLATGNVLQENIALNNNQSGGAGNFDLLDFNENCDANTWVDNFFGTRNQPCIN